MTKYKPSWGDAPEWANYLSMDADGKWFWYEEKPFYSSSDDRWHIDSGRYERAVESNGTLEKRPD